MDAKFATENVSARKQKVKELTSYLMHKHYGENDVEALIALMDDRFSWFGAGEQEYAVGAETVAAIFRQFSGLIPKCNISEEEYEAIVIEPEVYLCTGRLWVETDPASNMYLRVHQRITTVFRWVQGEAKCCHIHVSNPYSEMTENELGFPAQMGKRSYEYLQECIEAQKKQIEEQTALLKRMSYEDSLTGLYNRNKFNHILDEYEEKKKARLGIAYFDMNGLKEINDQYGHSAGDEKIVRIAAHINRRFAGKAYRIGGDEFVVVDEEMEEDAFRAAVRDVCEGMESEGISASVGISWRDEHCHFSDQFDEADRRMYEEKADYYSQEERDRRRKGMH